MEGEGLLHRPGREPVPGDVDDVVHPAHDVQVAVVVQVAGVARQIMAGVARQIGPLVTRVVAPERRQAPGRQRQLQHDGAGRAGRQLAAVLAEDADVEAGHDPGRRARLDRQHPQPDAVRGDGPTGLGLPPVIDHRHPQPVAGPDQRVGVAPLAGEEERPELRQVVLPDERAVRVLLLYRPEGGRRREQDVDAVLLDDAPERARVGCPDRLAFVQDRRGAAQQRP